MKIRLNESTGKKLTKKNIESLANDIVKFLKKYEINTDTTIYFNDKSISFDSHGKMSTGIKNPTDYFDYVPENHILSMSFEGGLYDIVNGYDSYTFKLEDEFSSIFNKYGVYYELGNAWNLSVFNSSYDDDDIEYTYPYRKEESYYTKQRKKIRLYNKYDTDNKELQDIMEYWYKKSKEYGDKGSCVLDAGFDFILDGQAYFMSAQSPYQGSLSWESSVDEIERMLQNIGAINVYYDYGNMD